MTSPRRQSALLVLAWFARVVASDSIVDRRQQHASSSSFSSSSPGLSDSLIQIHHRDLPS